MTQQGPRARAIATGALLGDPPPGRTPWAAPHDPNEVPRTGLSAVTATQDYRPDFLSVDQIRPGEPDKGPEGPLPDAPALAPKSTGNGAFEPEKPEATGFEGGADCPPDRGKGDALRPITAINGAGLTPSTPSSSGPIFEWVNPTDLLVNEAYQRDLAERSTKLIRRIVQGWDWTKFKPPVCSLGDDGMEVIDGQHTAIAAATHPHIDKIPVMIVETETVHDRAAAFIGQNMDRLGVTKMQLHKAAVAAGDEDALTIEQVCGRAGVTLHASRPHRWKVGDSMAVAAVGALISRRHAAGARRVLDVLVQAEAAPVTANAIRAAEMILFDADYADADHDNLADTIRSLGSAAEREAATHALAHRIPVWRALGIVWFRKCRKKRRAV
ncbi:DUF6551 family protein [Brevundimonas sp.]|uniref:DUF6551 family protein n=1 Tax=Brevundimonas sp. TaxID=1871086 RepID=UPI0028AE9F81|nr:DUF6551 family protein [Brevundimonas sp.]